MIAEGWPSWWGMAGRTLDALPPTADDASPCCWESPTWSQALLAKTWWVSVPSWFWSGMAKFVTVPVIEPDLVAPLVLTPSWLLTKILPAAAS